MHSPDCADQSHVLAAMQRWLEHAVIGLNLCPFAKHVHVKGRLAWRVSVARDEEGVYADLSAALDELNQSPADAIETTLLVLPHALERFEAFQLFDQVQAQPLLKRMGLRGLIQIATFHPQFVFAEVADPQDLSHCTNRSPWPAFHLLREASVARAVATIGGDAQRIVQANLHTLNAIGPARWAAMAGAWAAEPSIPPGAASKDSSGAAP
jgi:uncharacterized protein